MGAVIISGFASATRKHSTDSSSVVTKWFIFDPTNISSFNTIVKLRNSSGGLSSKSPESLLNWGPFAETGTSEAQQSSRPLLTIK